MCSLQKTVMLVTGHVPSLQSCIYVTLKITGEHVTKRCKKHLKFLKIQLLFNYLGQGHRMFLVLLEALLHFWDASRLLLSRGRLAQTFKTLYNDRRTALILL